MVEMLNFLYLQQKLTLAIYFWDFYFKSAPNFYSKWFKLLIWVILAEFDADFVKIGQEFEKLEPF